MKKNPLPALLPILARSEALVVDEETLRVRRVAALPTFDLEEAGTHTRPLSA
jgi:hypothetical protein